MTFIGYALIPRLEPSKWVRIRGSTRSITGLDRVGLKFFYKFQYRLIFDSVLQEPGSSGWTRGGPDWPTNPHGDTFWILQCWAVFLTKHIGRLANRNLASTNKSIIIGKSIISLLKKVSVSHKNALILDSNLYFYLFILVYIGVYHHFGLYW